MTLQEINKLYDDLCEKTIKVKFLNKEIFDGMTKLFEEVYLMKLREKITEKPCEHKNTIVANEQINCMDCGKIW